VTDIEFGDFRYGGKRADIAVGESVTGSDYQATAFAWTAAWRIRSTSPAARRSLAVGGSGT